MKVALKVATLDVAALFEQLFEETHPIGALRRLVPQRRIDDVVGARQNALLREALDALRLVDVLEGIEDVL